MRRREFLVTAVAAAGIARTRTSWAQRATQAKPAALDRIAIMTLNFQRLLKLPDLQESPERTLELFDLPQMLADKYGVHKIEFQHYHIPSTEPSYLKELRARIEKHKSRMTQINLEFGNLNMSAPELRNRLMAIDLTKMWVDHAVMLGAQRVMINQGQPTHENKEVGIPTLKKMADYGKSKNIIVSVETRGGGGGGGGRGTGGAAGAGAGSGTGSGAGTGSASGAAAPAAPSTASASPAPPSAPAAAAQAPAAAAANPNAPPQITGPARWMLLAEIIEGAGAYSNVDVGGAGAANQEELHACLKRMLPTTANSLHARVNTAWDLATAVKYLEGELRYKGLYTIESSRGHEGTQEIYDVLVATLGSERSS